MNNSLRGNNGKRKIREKGGQMEEEKKKNLNYSTNLQTSTQTTNHLHFSTPNSFKLLKQE
jgi:hypothetical protein